MRAHVRTGPNIISCTYAEIHGHQVRGVLSFLLFREFDQIGENGRSDTANLAEPFAPLTYPFAVIIAAWRHMH